MWLGVSGLLIIAFCTMLDIKGATMIGVLWVTFISWIPGTGASYFGEDSQVPGGEVRWDYFKKVVTVPVFGNTWAAYQWDLGNGQFWLATFTMLYVGFFGMWFGGEARLRVLLWWLRLFMFLLLLLCSMLSEK